MDLYMLFSGICLACHHKGTCFLSIVTQIHAVWGLLSFNVLLMANSRRPGMGGLASVPFARTWSMNQTVSISCCHLKRLHCLRIWGLK
jgi:hypothetical protein